jgi:hypothetical protein
VLLVCERLNATDCLVEKIGENPIQVYEGRRVVEFFFATRGWRDFSITNTGLHPFLFSDRRLK